MASQATQALKDLASKVTNFVALAVGMYIYSFYAVPKFFIDKVREHGQTIYQSVAYRSQELYAQAAALASSSATSLLESAQNNKYLKYMDSKYKSILADGQLLFTKATELIAQTRTTVTSMVNNYFVPIAVQARTRFEQVQAVGVTIYERLQGKTIVEKVTNTVHLARTYVSSLVEKVLKLVDVPAQVKRFQEAKSAGIEIISNLKAKYYDTYVPPAIAKGTTIVKETTTKAKELYEPTVEKLNAAKVIIEGKVLPLITSILDMFIAVQTRSTEAYKKTLAPYMTEEFVNSTKKTVTEALNNMTAKFGKVQAQ